MRMALTLCNISRPAPSKTSPISLCRNCKSVDVTAPPIPKEKPCANDSTVTAIPLTIKDTPPPKSPPNANKEPKNVSKRKNVSASKQRPKSEETTSELTYRGHHVY